MVLETADSKGLPILVVLSKRGEVWEARQWWQGRTAGSRRVQVLEDLGGSRTEGGHPG